MTEHEELRRSLRGAEWGLAATAAMTVVMTIGAVVLRSGFVQPPFPILFIDRLLPNFGAVTRVTAATLAHIAFGTLAGIPFAYLARPMTVTKGIGYAVFFLWFTMQVIFVPWLGWGDFGLIHSTGFALYTLVLHLAYGTTLGLLGARDDVVHRAAFDDLGRIEPHSR